MSQNFKIYQNAIIATIINPQNGSPQIPKEHNIPPFKMSKEQFNITNLVYQVHQPFKNYPDPRMSKTNPSWISYEAECVLQRQTLDIFTKTNIFLSWT